MKYSKVREESLKAKVAQDFFNKFNCTEIIKDIDFAVFASNSSGGEGRALLWAEAKQKRSNIFEMLTQLVLTIGKARTFNDLLPPPFLGCFDCEKIAFIPYSEIQDIFYQTDFNWKVPPSEKNSREFKLVYNQIEKILDNTPWKTFVFDFVKDEKELKKFIKDNFIFGKTETSKIQIDKNNFITIYTKWLEKVKPTIAVDWEQEKKNGVVDCDFYLADLISDENNTLSEKLSVLLKTDKYELNIDVPNVNWKLFTRIEFSDNQKEYKQFWANYKRPPHQEYWDYIVDNRHLLVPQDIRERKGSFYTPRIWVELSQKYLADFLGVDWQDEYYIWDCAAGTGNLLVGLTNKYNIWASTLDKADVDIMKERIQNGANLLESHVFQFDFLNDDFSKLPKGLQDIINDPKSRKKLIIYINPPYVEGDARIGKGRKGTQITKTHQKYQKILGKASAELSAQFFGRIYLEIPNCIIAAFSKMNFQVAPNYEKFRSFFLAKIEKIFIMPSATFDNVSGHFPISFKIWDTSKQEKFKNTTADVFDKNGSFIAKKWFFSYDKSKYISDWLEENSKNISSNFIAHLASVGNDFQNQNTIFIDDVNKPRKKGGRHTMVSLENLVIVSIYFAVRKVIPASWLNDRDQFLYPNDKWKADEEFKNNCLTYTLFNNNISSKNGVNHWIPFMEEEVNAKETFESHTMIRFITGKKIQNRYTNLFEQEEKTNKKLQFSAEAENVFNAGRELWRYYHTTISHPSGGAGGAVNASLYDIREYFQGRNEKGKMNNTSADEKYNQLIKNLRDELIILAKKIEPKVYEYGFLLN